MREGVLEGFLALGFLIGMQHALEADHPAAVGIMAAGHHGGLALGAAALAVGIGADVMAETAATAWGGL